MVKYRPHRESTKDEMEFDTIDHMYDFLLGYWNYWDAMFDRSDLFVTKDYGKDDRSDWKELRYVCTNRFLNKYDIPKCIGYCSIE